MPSMKLVKRQAVNGLKYTDKNQEMLDEISKTKGLPIKTLVDLVKFIELKLNTKAAYNFLFSLKFYKPEVVQESVIEYFAFRSPYMVTKKQKLAQFKRFLLNKAQYYDDLGDADISDLEPDAIQLINRNEKTIVDNEMKMLIEGLEDEDL